MRAFAVHGLGGGFAYGIQESGAELIGMAETSFAQATRRLNLPGIPEYLKPWNDVPVNRPDLIFGCPPCAGFSVAGSGLAQHDNPTHPINDGIRDWFNWVTLTRPTIAVMESVPRTFLSEAGQNLWRPLAAELPDYGWCVVSYDNRMVGVPQKRVRSLLWGMRGGVPRVFGPAWGYYGHQMDLGNIVVVNAIGDLGDPTISWEIDESGWGHNVRPLGNSAPEFVMRSVPWGGNARKTAEIWSIWEELERRGKQRPSFLWRRLHPQRPSPVLLADAAERVAHYRGDERGAGDALRYLSGREVARLMGYPDRFRLVGHLRREVGPALCQAVSPAVGRWVGVEAGRLLEDTDPYRGPVRHVSYRDLTNVMLQTGDDAIDLLHGEVLERLTIEA